MQKNMQALLRRQILHKKSCILQKTKFETKTIQQIETGTNYEKKSKRKFSIMSFMWRSNQVSIGAPKLLKTWPSSPSSWWWWWWSWWWWWWSWSWWWWWSWWWRGLQQRVRCMTAGPTPLGSIVCRIAAAVVVAKTSSLWSLSSLSSSLLYYHDHHPYYDHCHLYHDHHRDRQKEESQENYFTMVLIWWTVWQFW